MGLIQRVPYLAASSIVITGCTVGPDFEPPAAPKTLAYAQSGLPAQTVEIAGEEERTQSFLIGEKISLEWWRLFGCEPLNQLVKRGLQNSPTLEAAQAAVRQAAESIKVAAGGFYPSIDGQGGFSRQRESGASSGTNAPPIDFNLYNASVSVSYGLDIFGSIKRQVEASEAFADYQVYELEAAYLTLTSAIVTTAIQEASLRAQIQATKELIDFQEKQLELVKGQFRLGGASQSDILAQNTAVAQTRATLPPLNSALAQARHALAALVGDIPGAADLPSFTLEEIHLPTELPVTLPSDLVRHRPDIKAAEALMHQANAKIGVAKAARFPQLTLTGSYGALSDTSGSLFAGSSNVWSMAAQLLQPVFRGGALIAQEKSTIAAYDQTFAQYRQTVLQAFQQVADVLQALVEDARAYEAQKVAEESAGKALELYNQQYSLGAVSFVDLLVAMRTYAQTRIARIQAEVSRYADTAALFKALGGDCFEKRTNRKKDHETNQEKDCAK